MVNCKHCGKEFGSDHALEMHSKVKHQEQTKSKKSFSTGKTKKIRNWIIALVIIAGLIYGVTLLLGNVKTLPPVTMQGHIEVSPPSHVLREPMRLEVQKHMLEHADGGNIPGRIINYNCDDFECEEDLIEKLEEFASIYPSNVYVAPFPKMDVKIALTKLGRIETLDAYDESFIDDFINN